MYVRWGTARASEFRQLSWTFFQQNAGLGALDWAQRQVAVHLHTLLAYGHREIALSMLDLVAPCKTR